MNHEKLPGKNHKTKNLSGRYFLLTKADSLFHYEYRSEWTL